MSVALHAPAKRMRRPSTKSAAAAAAAAAAEAAASQQRSNAAAAAAASAVIVAAKKEKLSATGKLFTLVRCFIVALMAGSSRLQYVRKLRADLRESMPQVPDLDFIVPYLARWWAEILAGRRLVRCIEIVRHVDESNKAFSFKNAETRSRFAAAKDAVLAAIPTLTNVLPFCERLALYSTLFSSRSAPTVSLILPMIRDVRAMFAHGLTVYAGDSAVLSCLRDMKRSFDEVYDDEWFEIDFLRFACVLDPRVSWTIPEFVEWTSGLFTFASTCVSGWLIGSDVSSVAAAAKAAAAAGAADADADVTPAWMRSSSAGAMGAAGPQAATAWQDEQQIFKSQMSLALSAFGGRRKALGADALLWWRNFGPRVPRTARAARRILGIQASGVFSESVFNDAGRVSSPLRGHMSAERLRKLVLLNQWTKSSPSPSVMPAIPMPFEMLTAVEKDNFIKGKTTADMEVDEETCAAVARAERTALDVAARDAREKKAAAQAFRKEVLEEDDEEEEEEEEDGGIAADALDELTGVTE